MNGLKRDCNKQDSKKLLALAVIQSGKQLQRFHTIKMNFYVFFFSFHSNCGFVCPSLLVCPMILATEQLFALHNVCSARVPLPSFKCFSCSNTRKKKKLRKTIGPKKLNEQKTKPYNFAEKCVFSAVLTVYTILQVWLVVRSVLVDHFVPCRRRRMWIIIVE